MSQDLSNSAYLEGPENRPENLESARSPAEQGDRKETSVKRASGRKLKAQFRSALRLASYNRDKGLVLGVKSGGEFDFTQEEMKAQMALDSLSDKGSYNVVKSLPSSKKQISRLAAKLDVDLALVHAGTPMWLRSKQVEKITSAMTKRPTRKSTISNVQTEGTERMSGEPHLQNCKWVRDQKGVTLQCTSRRTKANQMIWKSGEDTPPPDCSCAENFFYDAHNNLKFNYGNKGVTKRSLVQYTFVSDNIPDDEVIVGWKKKKEPGGHVDKSWRMPEKAPFVDRGAQTATTGEVVTVEEVERVLDTLDVDACCSHAEMESTPTAPPAYTDITHQGPSTSTEVHPALPKKPARCKSRKLGLQSISGQDTGRSIYQEHADVKFDPNVGWVRHGLHSITTPGCFDYMAQGEDIDACSNIIRKCANYVALRPECFVFNEQEGTHTITSNLHVACEYDYDKPIHAASVSPLVIPHNYELVETSIVWAGQQNIKSLEISLADNYLLGGQPNSRAISSALGDRIIMPRPLIEWVASYFLKSIEVTDNWGLYAVGWLLHAQLLTFERFRPQINPIYAADGGNLIIRNVNVVVADVPALGELIKNDIDSGYITLPGTQYTDEEIIAFKLIADGMPRLTSPQGSSRTICQYFRSQVIPMRVYNWGPRAVAIRAIAAQDMQTALIKMATDRGEIDQLTAGYVRAAVLLRGRFIDRNADDNVNRWFTATLETGTFTWPVPKDVNFLWRSTQIIKIPAPTANQIGELEGIHSGSAVNAMHIPHLIGLYVHSAVCTTLIHFNVTGQDLNQHRRGHGTNNLNKVLSVLLTSKDIRRMPALIFTTSARMLEKAAGIYLKGSMIGDVKWCNGGFVGPNVPADAQAMWAATGQPFCRFGSLAAIAQFMELWPSNWGLTAPCLNLDIRGEFMKAGLLNEQAWVGYLGTGMYSSLFAKGTPFVYIPYTLLVLNVMQAQLHQVVPWAASADTAYFGDSRTLTWGTPVGLPVPPMLGQGYYEPGSVATFEYRTDRALSLRLPRANMSVRAWVYWSDRPTSNPLSAGIYSDFSVPCYNSPIGIDVMAAIEGFNNLNTAASDLYGNDSSTKEAQEN